MINLSRRQAMAGLAAGALLPALTGCQVAPGTGRSGFNLLSADDESKIGADTHPQIIREFGGAYDDPAVQAYVAGLGQRLVRVCETPEAEFRFTVLDSPVVNAMALPGGYIYVTRGLMALTANEAELAGVVGHEIGHVLGRHTAQRVSQAQATGLLAGILGAVVGTPGVADLAQLGAAAYLQSFSREQELEADHLGFRYLAKAGWDAHAMASMLDKLRDQARLEAMMAGRSPDSIDQFDFMASHPRTRDRVEAAMAEALGAPPQGALGTDTLLDRIDGMIYGDSPAQGVVRRQAFLHPDGFRFEVPEGFRMTNGTRAVTARDGSGALIVFDGAAAKGSGSDMLGYLTRVWMPRARLSGAERIDINGMAAATASTQGRTRQGQVDIRLVAIRFDQDSLYRFTFVTPPGRTARLGEALRRTTYSFRRLGEDERTGIRPLRLKVVRAAPGDTVERLAERMALPDWRAETLRALNGLDEGRQPQPGQRIKLVV
ncbi:M48 family metalloprotease [Magnetospirillum sp. UT-4]|uniref:M48 family metalloprotease n=1 Tax=Magnetospirillum sp. UT-4 TaxID=2681467 RepID=UPI00137D5468|nr:M48 family metalloprotease [Magnetospirillum sp. UT-4]CAA7612181.1 putative Zn-dependent protease [Magnetospirillum sp. UT-4]